MSGQTYISEIKDKAVRQDTERGFVFVHPSCPQEFSSVVTKFYSKIQANHSITYGNDGSIFLGLNEVTESFKKHISRLEKWVDVEFLAKLEINKIGYEESKVIRQSYEATLFSVSDVIEKSILKAENLLIEAMKESFRKSYTSEYHKELIGLLETTRFLFEFLRTRHPRRHLYINDQLDETRRKARPIKINSMFCELCEQEAKPIEINPIFCELCWRKAKRPTKDSRDIKPRFCRVHNQNREELVKKLCNLDSVDPSKHRNDLRKKQVFLEALSEIQTNFTPQATYSDMPIYFNEIDACERKKLYFSAKKQIMRNRYIAYYIAKRVPRKSESPR